MQTWNFNFQTPRYRRSLDSSSKTFKLHTPKLFEVWRFEKMKDWGIQFPSVELQAFKLFGDWRLETPTPKLSTPPNIKRPNGPGFQNFKLQNFITPKSLGSDFQTIKSFGVWKCEENGCSKNQNPHASKRKKACELEVWKLETWSLEPQSFQAYKRTSCKTTNK